MTISFSKLTYYYQSLFRTLWLSVSSADFYSDVHNKYRGYGIRYILNLFLISGLVFSVWNFSRLLDLERKMHPSNPDFEYILRQIPNMQYDGFKLLSESEMPIIIYDKNNRKIGAIDLKNELSNFDKNKLYAVINDTYIHLPVKIGASSNNTKIEYKYLFGSQPLSINYDTIIAFLPDFWRSLNKIYIYISMPIIGLIYFAITLLYNIPYAIFIWLITYISESMRAPKSLNSRPQIQVFDVADNNRSTSLQTTYRLTMFASGISIFLQPIAYVINPGLNQLIAIASLMSWFFMIKGILKAKQSKAI